MVIDAVPRSLISRTAMLAAISLLSAAPGGAQISLSHPTLEQQFTQFFHRPDREHSVAFAMTSDLALTSVGTRLRPDFAHSWFGLRATVRSVSNVFGLSRGNILAQSTAILTSNGNQYYDLPLSFTLLAGNLYDLSFEITEIPPNTGVELTEWFGFYQVFAMGNNPSFTVGGVIRVLDGGQFTLPNPHPSTGYDGYNFLPQHRLNAPIVTVPEPGTYALLASGLAAVAVVARRRRSR